MKPIVLAALASLALGACNFGAPRNTSTANTSAPAVVPDSVTVNGVVYTRAGASGPATASTPSTALGAPVTSPTPMPPSIPDSSATPSSSSDTLPSGGEPPAPTTSSHGG